MLNILELVKSLAIKAVTPWSNSHRNNEKVVGAGYYSLRTNGKYIKLAKADRSPKLRRNRKNPLDKLVPSVGHNDRRNTILYKRQLKGA